MIRSPKFPSRIRDVLLLSAVLAAPACARVPAADATHVRPSDPSPSWATETGIIVREELDRSVVEHGLDASYAVVLDVPSGRILALEGRRAGGTPGPAPDGTALVTGSTLKTFTMAVGLEERAIDPAEKVDCRTRAYPDGRVLRDPADRGIISFADGLAVSSNVCTSRVLDRVGVGALRESFGRMHLTDPPAPATTFTDSDAYASAMYAGGEVLATTPLAVAAGYAAIVRGGEFVRPTAIGTPPAPSERVLRRATTDTLLELLGHVVESPVGTGGRARVPGIRVVGKTGTAELDDRRTYASFVGAAWFGTRPVVVLVGMEVRGGDLTGGTGPAPAFARIVSRMRVHAPTS
ncbi:MAG: penicillin-binding transpeptidase domain-containing protein [Polyangiaceae bacterium]